MQNVQDNLGDSKHKNEFINVLDDARRNDKTAKDDRHRYGFP